MNIKPMIWVIALLIGSGTMVSSSANSVGFDQMIYYSDGGSVSIDLLYDFTDFATFGGSVTIIFDTTAIEFVSYTQAPYPPDVQSPASPIGSLVSPGVYEGVGIGTFEGFFGITSAGAIGTFVFNVFGSPSGSTPCGSTLCILPHAINPFIALNGQDITAEVLANGISSADVVASEIPVPAALWLLLSGLAVFAGCGRKSG